MKTTPTAALCLFALSALTAPAGAARPFVTDDAGIVALGSFESEASADYWSDKGAFGIGLKHGLTNRMDLGISMGHTAWPEEERTFDDATLAFKCSLIPGILSASFSSELGTTEYGVNSIISHTFGNFGINLNLGGDIVGSENHATLAWGANPTWTAGPATLGAELRGNQREANWWQVGTQVKLAGWIALDAGLGDDFTDGHDWHLASGIWIAFPTEK